MTKLVAATGAAALEVASVFFAPDFAILDVRTGTEGAKIVDFENSESAYFTMRRPFPRRSLAGAQPILPWKRVARRASETLGESGAVAVRKHGGAAMDRDEILATFQV
jgi:hypothetical protein